LAVELQTQESKVGAMVCVNDMWNEKEPEKCHKLVDTLVAECTSLTTPPRRQRRVYAWGELERQRGLQPILQKWGHIVRNLGGGSHLKEYIFKITGGTGKYAGAKGGGTYKSDQYAFRRRIRRQDRAAVVCPLVRKRKAGPFGGRIGPAKWTRGEASK